MKVNKITPDAVRQESKSQPVELSSQQLRTATGGIGFCSVVYWGHSQK